MIHDRKFLFQIFVRFMQELLKEGKSKEEVVIECTKACIALHVEDKRVCHGVTREFRVGVLYCSTC